MERVFDAHIHYSFDIAMPEMVEIFKQEFEQTGTDKYVFLSLPHHANGDKLHLSTTQNIKGMFLKHAFSPNAYSFAGLVHPQSSLSDNERARSYYEQAVKYYQVGYDGIKMLEGHPTLRRAIGFALDSNVYDRFYDFLEEVGMPIIMHVADPEESWSLETASESAKTLGRTYCGDFPSKKQLTSEVFGALKKHPKLKFGLAHFGFMSYDINEAEKFLSYENTFFDLTPGGEQLIKMSEDWDKWLKFFEKHQNRIVYGSDYYAFPKDENWEIAFNRRPKFLRQFFETDGEYLYIDQKFRGVKINQQMRDKIYRENFVNLLGQPKPIDIFYVKEEITRLLKDLPDGKAYYTKDKIIDISVPENRKAVIDRYVSDLTYMLREFEKVQND